MPRRSVKSRQIEPTTSPERLSSRKELSELNKLRYKEKLKNAVACLAVREENSQEMVSQVEEKLELLRERNLALCNQNFEISNHLHKQNNYNNKLIQTVKLMLDNLAFDSSLKKSFSVGEDELGIVPVSGNGFKFSENAVKILIDKLQKADCLESDLEDEFLHFVPKMLQSVTEKPEAPEDLSEIFSTREDFELSSVKGVPSDDLGVDSPLWCGSESEFTLNKHTAFIDEDDLVTGFGVKDI